MHRSDLPPKHQPIQKDRILVAVEKKIGRPSSFSQALADEICARIIGGESLRSICRDREMPAERTVFLWLSNPAHEAFVQQYARARMFQTEVMLEDILAIADGPALAPVDVMDKKQRIDTRKWAMGKLHPKKYGETSERNVNVTVGRKAEELTDDELASLIGDAGAS